MSPAHNKGRTYSLRQNGQCCISPNTNDKTAQNAKMIYAMIYRMLFVCASRLGRPQQSWQQMPTIQIGQHTSLSRSHGPSPFGASHVNTCVMMCHGHGTCARLSTQQRSDSDPISVAVSCLYGICICMWVKSCWHTRLALFTLNALFTPSGSALFTPSALFRSHSNGQPAPSRL